MNRQEFRKSNYLSPESYTELKRRYYETSDSMKELIKEFNLVGVSPSQLYLIFDDIDTDIKCPHCEAFMKHKPTSRTQREVSEWFCPNCEHKKYKYEYSLCYCDGCKNQRESYLKKFLEDEHVKEYGCLKNLKLQEILFLGGLIFNNNNLGTNFYYDEDDFSFFEEETNRNIITSLYKKNCIVISRYSQIKQFCFSNNEIKINEEGFNYKFNQLLDLPFDLWLGDQDKTSLLNGEIIYKKDTKKIWRLINIMEANFHFKKILDSYYIKNYNEQEILEIISSYMNSFSLAETLSVLNYVTSMHANDIQTKKVNRKEGLNEIIDHLYRYYKWAKDNREKLKNYSRCVKITQLTSITQYFYKMVIKDREALYNCIEQDN